jgi:hypothetical protein
MESVNGCTEPCFLLTVCGWLHLTYGSRSTALAVDQKIWDNYILAFLGAQMALKKIPEPVYYLLRTGMFVRFTSEFRIRA